MAIPLKAISKAFWVGGLIFEGLETFEIVGTTNSAGAFVAQTLKDQPAVMCREIFLRYRLSGNTHASSAKILALTRLGG